MSKFRPELDTKLHLFEMMIKPILLYGYEVWGYGNIEKIGIFHRSFLRRVLLNRKSALKQWCKES